MRHRLLKREHMLRIQDARHPDTQLRGRVKQEDILIAGLSLQRLRVFPYLFTKLLLQAGEVEDIQPVLLFLAPHVAHGDPLDGRGPSGVLPLIARRRGIHPVHTAQAGNKPDMVSHLMVRHTGPLHQVAIAAAIHSRPTPHGHSPTLRLQDDSLDAAARHRHLGRRAEEDGLHAGLAAHLVKHVLARLGVHHGTYLVSRHTYLEEASAYLVTDAAHGLCPRLIGPRPMGGEHRQDQAARPQTSQMIVSLHEDNAAALARGTDGRGETRRATAHDHHVGRGHHGYLARGFLYIALHRKACGHLLALLRLGGKHLGGCNGSKAGAQGSMSQEVSSVHEI